MKKRHNRKNKNSENKRMHNPLEVKIVSMAEDDVSKNTLIVAKKTQYLSVFFSILTLLISLFSVYISFNALQLSKESNIIAIMPDVRMKDDYISIYWNEKGEVIYLSDDFIGEDMPTLSGYLSVPGVGFVNIGTGTAKDIVYDWNYKENFSIFQQLLKDDCLIDLEENDDNLSVNIYCYGETPCSYPLSKQNNDSFITIEETDYQTFPLTYLVLLGKYCHNIFPHEGLINYAKFYSGDDLPQIRLEITYYNNVGQRFEKDMVVKFTPVSYKFDQNSSGRCTFKVTTEESNEKEN